MINHRSAIAVIAGAMADLLRPLPPLSPSAWAENNLVVPDGPRAGTLIDLSLTPYLRQPLDMLGPDSPVNQIVVRKSAQTGFTTLLIAAIGYAIDRDPCEMMVIQPTDAALSDFNRVKLQQAIDGSKALSLKVYPQTSRSSSGSTGYAKRFAGGGLALAIATSAADLRSKTVKKLFRDEIDQYPDDLDKQGDPLDISDGRLMSFLAQGDWKKADISTPTIKGESKIDRRFHEGDQRFWRFACPGCGTQMGFEWGENFRFAPAFPYGAHYVAPCCGAVIEAHERNRLVRSGEWVATAPGPGRFPSYHFDALSSPFVPWDEIARTAVEAGDDPLKQKTLHNLWLGMAYELKGDAPDHEVLFARREAGLERGVVPPGGFILVGAADVQMRGIWWSVKALGPNRQSWLVDAGYVDGDTSSHDGGAFDKLRSDVLERQWPDCFGTARALDAFGIDSGYRSHVVYAWVRRVQRLNRVGRDVVLALKGDDGWGRPAIGMPRLVDIDMGGRKVRQGCKLWSVGTWPLKGAFYEDLHKSITPQGAPEGYHHHGQWVDMNYLRQITAEYLSDETLRGKTRRVWKLRSGERDNHWLDCEVYIMALADHLGLPRMTSDDWAVLAAERLPAHNEPATLFTPPAPPAPAQSDASTPTPAAQDSGWLAPNSNWLRR